MKLSAAKINVIRADALEGHGVWSQDVLSLVARVEELEMTMRAIHALADGRRHYNGDEYYAALGEVRDMCVKVLP